MSEMIERIARAMFRADNEFFDETDPINDGLSHLTSDDPDYWRTKARAVWLAMREPTDAMLKADLDLGGYGYADECYQADPAKIWRGMIDAELGHQNAAPPSPKPIESHP